jgi:hypothetical protein
LRVCVAAGTGGLDNGRHRCGRPAARRGGTVSTPTAGRRSVERQPSGENKCPKGGGSRCLFK